jgi:cytochrome P450
VVPSEDAPATVPLPPRERGLPVVGLLPQLLRDPLRCCAQVAAKHGDIARVSLGVADVYVVSHPEHLKYVLQEASPNFGKGTAWAGIRVVIGNSLPASDGAFWLRQRRIMQPAFHRERIASLTSLMNTAIAARLDSWGAAADRDEAVDVHAEMKRLTRDIVLGTMFSASLQPGEAAILDAAVETMTGGLGTLMWTGFLPRGIPNPAKTRVLRAVAEIDRVLYRIIREREASSDPPHDLLSMLLEARDAESGEGMTPEQVRDEVMGIFVASYEATALALTWTFYALTQHPEVARRLADEIAGLDGRAPTVDDLRGLAYARMTFEESMRFYPPGWVIPRQAVADDAIGGYRIPAGAIVLLCGFLTNRRPDYWESPDVFDPGRFAPERAAGRSRYASLGFGGGPRQCIGNTFAMTEAQLIIAAAVQRYEFTLARPTRPRASHVMLKPAPKMLLRVRRR